MNFQHLKALLLLRFQLSRNQIRKAGKLNVVISIIGVVCALVCTVSAFFFGLIGGAILFPDVSTNVILATWNAIVALFLFIWLIGLMVEIQQTELMSLDKLLHLPLSLRGAFFLNYTSSFFNTAFLLFVPAMFGLAMGMVIARGLAMAMAFPLMLGFLFLTTTVTYQLRGWLARLMENKRRRGTVIALITIVFVVASQIPNLIAMSNKGQRETQELAQKAKLEESYQVAIQEVDVQVAAGRINPRMNGWLIEAEKAKLALQAKEEKQAEKVARRMGLLKVVRTADAYFPPGWLPLGITKAAEGNVLFGFLVTLAMFSMGLVSLSFSYRASMRKYMGVEKRSRRKPSAKPVFPNSKDEFLFKKLPLVSEHVSAVAVASFRGLIRAPESKMILLMPIIFGLLIALMLFANKDMLSIPAIYRPVIPIGVITVMMFAVTSLLFNQFGLDRDGFRALVLSPVDRKDILIGKNISVVPLAFSMCVLLLIVLQFFIPQSPLTFVASLVQIPAIYLLYCMLGNVISVFFPMGIKRGTMQPANPRFLPMLLMVIGSMLGPGMLLIPTTFVCGAPLLLEMWLGHSMAWLYLLLSLIQLVATLFVYRWFIKLQGDWLWLREPKILDVVANIPE